MSINIQAKEMNDDNTSEESVEYSSKSLSQVSQEIGDSISSKYSHTLASIPEIIQASP